MGKYYGNGGKKVGKVGNEKYYINRGENIVQTNNKYYPVNSTLLKKKEFKEYVLSLLEEGIPQIYIVEELPEEVYTYALIFVQNEEGTNIYVDKDGLRTYINIEGGEGGGDAVDIVNNVPQEPKNNTIYFVNNNANKESKIDKKQLKDTPLECDIYVCDNNVLRKIDVDYTEVLNQAKEYTDEKVLSASGAEVVTSLPAEMTENKLYFATRTQYLIEDNYYVSIKQNGQLYHLGHIEHYPASKKVLYIKQVFMIIPQRYPQPGMYLSLNYYLPNPFEATYDEVWNYLGELGCVDENHLYPVGGHYGSSIFCGIFKTGAETYKRIGYTLFNSKGLDTNWFDKSTKLTITSTVIKLV